MRPLNEQPIGSSHTQKGWLWLHPKDPPAHKELIIKVKYGVFKLTTNQSLLHLHQSNLSHTKVKNETMKRKLSIHQFKYRLKV